MYIYSNGTRVDLTCTHNSQGFVYIGRRRLPGTCTPFLLTIIIPFGVIDDIVYFRSRRLFWVCLLYTNWRAQ